jgi:hypothetical protein
MFLARGAGKHCGCGHGGDDGLPTAPSCQRTAPGYRAATHLVLAVASVGADSTGLGENRPSQAPNRRPACTRE